ncbi:dUTP diphosphatase [Kineococcus rubinsiae]|uniref:dUTP diphosphatase n=1 Tax=Kineococcus rubinsiae TaxID=2609562 RepID=UPI0014307261|nr:dUTP diphosphatase [Kineococcus rubinsiae]NIZ92117.1 dUTP diphosphatase [Kineococcus rubinsiae]
MTLRTAAGAPELEVPAVLGAGADLPAYAHPGDAGADLTTRVDVTLGPGERATVPTGVSIALPDGCAAFVVPRSGLAARLGLTVLNSPGTVDAGYRGEVRVTLLNTDRSAAVELRAGDRIAQLVVQRVERVRFVPVEDLEESVRGTGGHGSTGGAGALAGGPPPTSSTTPPTSSTTPPGGPQ